MWIAFKDNKSAADKTFYDIGTCATLFYNKETINNYKYEANDFYSDKFPYDAPVNELYGYFGSKLDTKKDGGKNSWLIDDKLSKNECLDDLPYCTYTCTLYRQMKQKITHNTDIEFTADQELGILGGYRRYSKRVYSSTESKIIDKGISELIPITPKVHNFSKGTTLASSIPILILSLMALQ